MYSIGEFSRLTRLSIKTLRFYDRQGLLKPAVVDSDSGYRYYQPTQTLVAGKIQYYRNCDLSLKDIAELLKLEALGAEAELLAILEGHEEMLAERIASMQRMQRWIRSLRTSRGSSAADGESRRLGDPDGPIEIVAARPQTVVAAKKFGDYEDVFPLIEELTDFALSQSLKIDGPPILLWGEAMAAGSSSPGAAAEVEVAVPVSGRFQSTSALFRRRLPGGDVARLVFRGARSESGRHYERLFSWIFENGCQIDGSFREIYLNSPGVVKEADYLTELQVPILIGKKRKDSRRAPRSRA
ncbi:MAG: MerR family transcriptional regulator [bacterium]|nr:MerR family transcriptional regulator [bacterium]